MVLPRDALTSVIPSVTEAQRMSSTMRRAQRAGNSRDRLHPPVPADGMYRLQLEPIAPCFSLPTNSLEKFQKKAEKTDDSFEVVRSNNRHRDAGNTSQLFLRRLLVAFGILRFAVQLRACGKHAGLIHRKLLLWHLRLTRPTNRRIRAPIPLHRLGFVRVVSDGRLLQPENNIRQLTRVENVAARNFGI